MKISVVNEKGLFGDISTPILMTQEGLNLLVDYEQNLPNGKDKEQVAKLIRAIQAFPILEQDIHISGDDYLTQDFKSITKSSNGYTRVKVRGPGWLHVDKFVSKSSSTEWVGENKGWEALKEFTPLLPLFLKLTTELKLWHETYRTTYSASRMKSIGTQSIHWEIKEQGLEQIAQSTSFAIYSDSCKGFLNDKGSYTPLAGSRLFESAEAANRTINSRRLSGHCVVVEVEIAAQKIDPVIPFRSGFDDLLGALALVERKRLRESLDKAQLSDLLEQVEKLKTKLGEEINTQSPTIKSSRRI